MIPIHFTDNFKPYMCEYYSIILYIKKNAVMCVFNVYIHKKTPPLIHKYRVLIFFELFEENLQR